MADHHRPLVPKPRGARQTKESAPRQSPRPKRNNIGSACSACKARKLKCSGNPPCQNCLKTGVECTVDHSNDKRRKSVVKRKLEVLEDRKDLLLNLVRTIRDSGDRRTLQLLDLVRSNASLTEIKFYLNDDHNDRPHAEPGYEKKKAPEFSDMRSSVHLPRPSDSPSTEARNAFNPQSLVDIPLFDLPASPWTTVVQDAEMVSRLVSLWFTWFHPFSNWLDRDLFLRDMKSGDLKAQFCSPVLVNAMLAVACTHSNCASVYAVPGDIASKGAHFYYEAKRFLENEEGRISLPTVQGLGLLATFAGIAGKDRHGWIYQSHLIYAVQELSQQSRFPYSTGSADMYKRSQVDHSIWGLFNIATDLPPEIQRYWVQDTDVVPWPRIKAMLHHKQPPIKPPVQHYPPPPLHAEHFWCPYPLQLEGIKVHTDCLFYALCELNRIVYDLGCTFFNYEKRLHRTELELRRDKLRTRLQDWANQLPSCLKDPEGTQVPHLLSLHMYYYSICITLDQYAPSIKLDLDTNNESDPRLSNARRISYLMRIHRSSWGIDRIPVSNIVSISTALLALLTNLSDPQNCDAFVNLAVAAKAFSRRWVLGRVKLELVHQQAQKMGVDLPGETKPLFSDLEVTSRKRAKLE